MDEFTLEHIIRLIGDKRMPLAELKARALADLCDIMQWEATALKNGWSPPDDWLVESRRALHKVVMKAIDLGRLVVTEDWKLAVPKERVP